MGLLANAFVNFFRLLRNAYARTFGGSADFIWVSVTGDLPEFEPPKLGFIRRRLVPRAATLSLAGVRDRLDRLLADGRTKGVILRVENLDAGWATLEELRGELDRFREGGKRIVAYLVGGGDTRSYYLASSADEVFASPLSTLNIVGLRVRINFLKDALNALGLEAEVLAVSPYKSAGDPISRSGFSEEAREQVERLLDRRYNEIVVAVSAGRGIPLEEVHELIDYAPYSATEAVVKGLLDGALYEDELASRLADGARSAKLVEWRAAKRKLRVPYRRRTRKVVGLVDVKGTITQGRSRRLPLPLPFLGGEQAGSDSIVASLRVAEKSRRIAAILLHVDSPGGDAFASDLIWREVERIRPKKPVVVLMGNAAASGGYYVSAPASYIVARKNTITGSIGVILARPIAAKLLGKLKINPAVVGRGARSNLLDPRRRPTRDEMSVLKVQLCTFYDEFKDRVAAGRGLESSSSLEPLAGGRVWTGEEALRRRLVDELGGFRVAMNKARTLAGISAEASSVLVRVSPPRNTRPTPEEPVQEVKNVVQSVIPELAVPHIWALAPYEISDDW